MTIKFVDKTDIHFTAGEATTVAGLDLGPVFSGDTKYSSFRIGNTGASAIDLSISVSGVNSSINNDVTFSLDGESYSSTVNVSGVMPNEITDLIRVKYASQEGDVVGEGTFLIRVDES